MTPERWQQIGRIFTDALKRERDGRAAFVHEACGSDSELRREVEALLSSDEQAGSFLEALPSKAAELTEPGTRVRSAHGEGVDLFLGRVVSNYRLEERLAAGGMGVLYRATDLKLGRSVAVKVLSRHLALDETARARFLREARAASALDHPNIGAIYHVEDQDHELFIVMALYRGETLKQRLERGALALSEALEVLRQVALGLEAAHRAGIIHRDIKPGNLLRTDEGIVKILDFGLAKLTSESQATPMTQTGEALGTISYMSPEQLRGRSVDARSDLWSFGVVAYELFAGVSPFQADSSPAIAMRILSDEPPALATIPGVPQWLAELVTQLLRKQPSERPQCASDILRRLEGKSATKDGAPTPALPLLQRPGRSRAVPVVLLVVIIVLLAAGSGVYYYFIRHGSVRGPSTIPSTFASSAASVAVLPFASLSTGEENAYFAQGFHDELLRELGRIGDLRVISRTSVMQYKESARNLRETAEALGASSIVEGSVARAGNRVRVEVRLIDARNDRQTWGDRYDRDVTDIFAIQAAVAEEIAGALNARLSVAQRAQIERKPTQSAEAYDFYLRALEYANRPDYEPKNLQIAQRLYQRAIQTDPSFALARAKLASLRMSTYWFRPGTPDSVVEEAREEADRALRLQPELPEAHLALGLYHYWGRRADDRALQEFEAARPGLPAETINFIAAVQRRQGKFDDAIRSLYQAVQLDPRSPRQMVELAFSLFYTRRYEEADLVLDRALAIAPDFIVASVYKALVRQAWKGETDLARAVLRGSRGRLDPQGRLGQQGWVIHLLEHNPAEALPLLDSVDSDSIEVSPAIYPKAFFHAAAHEALGDATLASQEYQAAGVMLEAEVKKYPDRPFQRIVLARAYAGLGRKEDALREARRAVESLPISKDALYGSWLEVYLAAVETRVGDTDAAIEHIRQLLSIPSWLSPAMLRTEARWGPLRDDPRFRNLAELEQ